MKEGSFSGLEIGDKSWIPYKGADTDSPCIIFVEDNIVIMISDILSRPKGKEDIEDIEKTARLIVNKIKESKK